MSAEELVRLEDAARGSPYADVQITIVDKLQFYGFKAIPVIRHIAEVSQFDEVKEYCDAAINKLYYGES